MDLAPTKPLVRTELFMIRARVHLSVPARFILVQELMHCGERVFWIDGVDVADPLLMPVSFFRRDVVPIGSYEQFIAKHLEAYLRLAQVDPDDSYSPSLMARAVQGLQQKPSMTPADVLRAALADGQALREMERRDRQMFEACLSTF